jgi:large subunit ribosomal protein L10
MNRTEKEQLVSDLKTKLQSATALYYTDFTGLNVKRMTDLRRKLRKANVEYVVIKNTLALRAVNESGLIGERLRGPTGLVVAKDPIAAAKVITDFAKENDQKPAVKGGVFEGTKIDKAQVTKLASMPSREQMLAQPAVPVGRVRRRAQRHPVHVRGRARRSARAARERRSGISRSVDRPRVSQ